MVPVLESRITGRSVGSWVLSYMNVPSVGAALSLLKLQPCGHGMSGVANHKGGRGAGHALGTQVRDARILSDPYSFRARKTSAFPPGLVVHLVSCATFI